MAPRIRGLATEFKKLVQVFVLGRWEFGRVRRGNVAIVALVRIVFVKHMIAVAKIDFPILGRSRFF